MALHDGNVLWMKFYEPIILFSQDFALRRVFKVHGVCFLEYPRRKERAAS